MFGVVFGAEDIGSPLKRRGKDQMLSRAARASGAAPHLAQSARTTCLGLGFTVEGLGCRV